MSGEKKGNIMGCSEGWPRCQVDLKGVSSAMREGTKTLSGLMKNGDMAARAASNHLLSRLDAVDAEVCT